MMIKKLRFLIFFALISQNTWAQIDLTMPANRQVYQRNKQNTATIYIGGSYSGQFDKIEARTTLLDSKGEPKSPLQQSAWTTLVNNPTGGTFLHSLSNVRAGWYRLEVRAIQNAQVIGKVNTIKVGVGEVFVVAGQSNARGDLPIRDTTLYGAQDDRVNCIDLNDWSETSIPKYPEFTHMEPRSQIAPTGGCSWVWGPMGDLVAKNWDVPVVFYNAAVGGTSVFDWRSGTQLASDVPRDIDFSKGWPYVYLKKTLQYYCSLTGIRAVLWHQGENDTGIFNATNLDPVIYRDNLMTVINTSRSQSDKNISWVIAKASRTNVATSWMVIAGQQLTVDQPNFNTFLGPETDPIQPDASLRDAGGVHFVGTGLLEVGQAWFNSINNTNFLLNSQPYPAIAPEMLRAGTCQNNNQVAFRLPDGYTEYSWYTDNYSKFDVGQNYQAINKKSIVAYMKDANRKNYIFTPPVEFNAQGLEILTDKSPNLCQGQTLTAFASSFNNNFVWNTGATTRSITIDKEADYNLTVSSKNIYGCENTATKLFTMKVNPIPATPRLVTDVPSSICIGSSVTIKPDSAYKNVKYIWNDGSKTDAITISKNGQFNLKVVDSNNCESGLSNSIMVQVNPLPKKPEIQAGGSTIFCAEKTVTLAVTGDKAYEWYRDNVKIPEFNTQFVNASLPGLYKGRVLNEFGCPSELSDGIEIRNYPLPTAPTIDKSGPTAFCAGGSLSLTALYNTGSLKWFLNNKNTLYTTNNSFEIATQSTTNVNTESTYFATVTDERGCESHESEKVKVSVRGNPSNQRIDQVGTFSLEAKTSLLGLAGTSYEWFNNGQKIAGTESILKTSVSGSYQTIAKITYNIAGQGPLTCKSNISNSYLYFAPVNEIFAVFNNPSHDGFFTIESNLDYDLVQVSVITPLGKQVYKGTITQLNNQKQLNLSELPNGMYKLRFVAGNRVVVKSIIIDK